MTRLVLLLVLALVTWFYFPETRAILLSVVEPVVAPITRRNTEEEMGQVGRNVLDHERLTSKLPTGSEWLAWLDYRYVSEDAKQDPWGSIYQLVVWKDSVGIVSFGPDRIRATKDDFHIATRRE